MKTPCTVVGARTAPEFTKSAVRIRQKTTLSRRPQHRCVVTRNDMPTRLEEVSVRCPGFRFSGYVCFPLPLPPGDPYVFRSLGRAKAAVGRTERLCRLLRESIHLDYLLAHFPALQSFALPANYAVERLKKKRS